VLSAGAVATAGFVRTPARAAQFTWKCGNGASATHPLNVRLDEAFSKIRTETGGQLDLKLFPNSQLGGDTGMVSQLRLGALETMAQVGELFDSLIPVASINSVPFAFSNYEVPHKAFDGSLGALLRYEFLAKGLFAFDHVYDSGFRQFTTSTKPIRTVDDLQGMKLRVTPSKFRLDVFRSLGASPTAVNYAEVYSALQTHIVDGEENPLVGIEDLRFYEVQKYCSLSNHIWGTYWFLVNKEKWDSLPRTFQAIMRKNINAGALLQRRDFATVERNVRDRLTRHGLLFNDVDVASFRQKLRASGFYARWRDEWGAAAWSELEKYSGPLV
jgi:TRAP-type transport system periplasmic protein